LRYLAHFAALYRRFQSHLAALALTAFGDILLGQQLCVAEAKIVLAVLIVESSGNRQRLLASVGVGDLGQRLE